MTSLTRIAIIARKTIRLMIYGIIFLILARFLIKASVKVYRYYFPKPPPPATVAFGKLSPLPFPEKEKPASLNFTLETPNGELPVFATQAKVYFMPKTSPDLLTLENAKRKAQNLGFSAEGEEISETVYRFPHSKVPSSLTLNIINGVFSVGYDLKTDPSPLERRALAAEIAVTKARSFLSGGNALPADLTGPVESEYLKVENQNIVHALSLSEASLVRINFFRKPYDNLPSLTDEPKNGNVWFIVSGIEDRAKQIIAGEFHYFPVDETKFATYPIKTSQTAWEELKAGGGYIANLGANEDGKITVRRVYLAYYDPGTATEFFQPIIVFEGDRGFMAYVPAITADYYGE